jgi:hypothetical protein
VYVAVYKEFVCWGDADAGFFVDVIVRGFEGGFLLRAVFTLEIHELKVIIVSRGIIDL